MQEDFEFKEPKPLPNCFMHMLGCGGDAEARARTPLIVGAQTAATAATRAGLGGAGRA